MKQAESHRRVRAVVAMHGADLLRRRAVLVLLLALPLMLYAAMERDDFAVVMVGTLMTLSIGGPALFVMLGGRDIDPRLGLAGFRPLEIVAGRYVLLAGLGSLTALAFSALVILVSQPPKPLYTVLGLLLMAVVAAALGLALGAVMQGDLEAMLTLIAVVGVQLVTSPLSALHQILPLRGPVMALRLGNDRDITALSIALPTALWLLFLATVAFVAVSRRAPSGSRR
jgi:hypothetical protein